MSLTLTPKTVQALAPLYPATSQFPSTALFPSSQTGLVSRGTTGASLGTESVGTLTLTPIVPS